VAIRIGQLCELVTGEAHDHAAIKHSDRGRRRAARAHGRFALARDFKVNGRWQALNDDGGLEGDDAAALAEGGRDLVRDGNGGNSKVAHAAQSVQ